MNHVSHNPKDPKASYRIFEPQWKEVILLWLGQEEVQKKQKEEFIKSLLEFQDECLAFYEFRAYFLAVAGIAEFRECIFANEIVTQIINWSFGEFSPEQQNWHMYLSPIGEGARIALLETDRNRALNALINLLHTTQNQQAVAQVVGSLGEFGTDNSRVITVLTTLLRGSQDEWTRVQVAVSLIKIGASTSEAVRFLIDLLLTLLTSEDISTEYGTNLFNTTFKTLVELGAGNSNVRAALIDLLPSVNEEIHSLAIDILGEIGVRSSELIAVLTDLLHTSQNEWTRLQAAESLIQIGASGSEVSTTLTDLLRHSPDDNTRGQMVWRLWCGISTESLEVSTAMIDLLSYCQDEGTCNLAVQVLGKVGAGKSEVIVALTNLLHTCQNERTRLELAKSLGKVDPGNPEAIAIVLALSRTSQDQWTRLDAARSLGELDPGNLEAIAILLELSRISQNDNIRCQAAKNLAHINPGNSEAVTTLLYLLQYSQDVQLRSIAARALGEVNASNIEVIAALVNWLHHKPNKQHCLVEMVDASSYLVYDDYVNPAVSSLKQILKGNLFSVVITGLRDCLIAQIEQKNFEHIASYYEVIWHCAKNMTYPEFYYAWHGQPSIVQALENQLIDIPSQIQPTDKTYPIAIDAQTLKLETNTSAIAQKFCTKIHRKAGYTDIPTVNDAAQLQQYIPRIQDKLQKPNLALILHGSEPNEHLLNFCYSLGDRDLGIYISLITSKPIEQPLKGFLPNQNNLLSAVQSWINGIG